MSLVPQPSRTESFFAECNEFFLISELSDHCYGRLGNAQIGIAAGPFKRRNEHRILNIELRRALTQPDNIDLILDFDWFEDNEKIVEVTKLLQDMCQLLDGLSICVAEISEQRSSDKYANLNVVLAQIETSDTEFFQLFSGSGSSPSLFKHPSKVNRAHGIQVIKDFNRFLDQLPGSYIDSNVIIERPPTTALVSENEPSNMISLPVYQNHEEAAIKAIFSRFSRCNHQKAKGHELLVQLPTTERILSGYNQAGDFEMDLFLNACPDLSRWQEAQVMRVRGQDRYLTPELEPSICEVINDALHYAGGLHFHMQDLFPSISEEDFKIPMYQFVEPKRGQRNSFVTLPELLDDGTFVSKPRLEQSRHPRGLRSVSMQDKKTLAVQILFGILMCRRYGSTIATWDSQKVFILCNEDEEQSINKLIYVSCAETKTPTPCIDLLDPEKILGTSRPPPSRTCTEMAKVLLEIGLGNRLVDHDANGDRNDEEVWTELYGRVRQMKARKDSSLMDEISILDMLPYVAAADRCLRLPLSYRSEVSRLKRGQGVDKVDAWSIVESIVRDQIISELLKDGCVEPIIKSMDSMISARNQAQEASAAKTSVKAQYPITDRGANPSTPRQNAIALFDASSKTFKTSSLVGSAEEFFSHLTSFRNSFESCLEKSDDPTARKIRIAILDTGINKSSVGIDFDGIHMKVEWCTSFVGDPDETHDYDGHGTHCASLLRKAAPDAEIYVAKVFSRNEFDLKQAGKISEVNDASNDIPYQPSANNADQHQAIKYAVKHWDVDIISMSFGLHLPSSEESMPEWRKVKADIQGAIDLARGDFICHGDCRRLSCQHSSPDVKSSDLTTSA
ncbi:hypothetical protein CORC01_01638 [Colletotrichum orchidophilum]|uniref:Uncharacterized protein n=1 Tax=Colletotrichum orchidophilum TaxID=1209926 RepID=A0A1G4BN40_9PEZI|nr:uncharacterized protein CORC01_01638 [Colletotrichum orchidophilum]OHF02880.1 hypothetical protein CORC01_01638 [Colletotrichum orchidophilum]